MSDSLLAVGDFFQAGLEAAERRTTGTHYTDEATILRVIRPLFLDDLYRQFYDTRTAMDRRAALEWFQNHLAGLKFLDPACGAGNFLAVTYRELSRLEALVIQELYDGRLLGPSKVNASQLYGIEIDARAAKLAVDALDGLDGHSGHPHITNADALEVDWNTILPATECAYILCNPPYGGAKYQTNHQRRQVRRATSLAGTLDYSAAWLAKAATYSTANHHLQMGFVVTNSITQGEQVAQLWPALLDGHGLRIGFAYQPFVWQADTPGAARVHIVIVGLGRHDRPRRLFSLDGDMIHEDNPPVISPYLRGAKQAVVVRESTHPLHGLPAMHNGTKPLDGGHYIFTDQERDTFLQDEPNAKPYMMPYVGGAELIRGTRRWLLTPGLIPTNILEGLPAVRERVTLVEAFRRHRSESTSRLDPTAFGITMMPKGDYLAIPVVSSQKRPYIPMAFLAYPTIPNTMLRVVPSATLGLFGLLTSGMHMAWMRRVGGRLKSDYRYSIGTVYNTFPVPDGPLDILAEPARAVLEARHTHHGSTLSYLYDPDTMPPDLLAAHQRLDGIVDRLYRQQPFGSDDERAGFLLEAYGRVKTLTR